MADFDDLSLSPGFKRQVWDWEPKEPEITAASLQSNGNFYRNAQQGSRQRRQQRHTLMGYIQFLRGEDCIDLIIDSHRENLDVRSPFYGRGNGNIRRRAFSLDFLKSRESKTAIIDRFERHVGYLARHQPPRTQALSWFYRYPYLNGKQPPQQAVIQIYRIIQRITDQVSAGNGRTLWDDVIIYREASHRESQQAQGNINSASRKLRQALTDTAHDSNLHHRFFSTLGARAAADPNHLIHMVENWAGGVLAYLRGLNHLRRGGRAVNRRMAGAPNSREIANQIPSIFMRAVQHAWDRLSDEEQAVLRTEEGWNSLVREMLPEMQNLVEWGMPMIDPDLSGMPSARSFFTNTQEFLFTAPLPDYAR